MSGSVLDRRVQRRRWTTAGAATLAGLVVLGVAFAVGQSWRNDLPNPVAVHWGPGGEVNGFGSLDSTLGLMLVAGAALVLLFGAVTGFLGQSAGTRRMGVAGTIWSALYVPAIVLGTLYAQRGLSNARDVGSINSVLLIAIAVSVVPAVIVAALVPGDPRLPTVEHVDQSAPRVNVAAGERASWIGYAESPAALFVGLGVSVLVAAIVLVTRVWPAFAAVIVVLAIVAAMSSFVVRVDRDGLTVRSALGWPRTRIPLDEVVRADVIQVRPVRDFGGWGWRVGRHGRVGIALRAGEALLVERTGGRSLAVTVDNASQAAGLLNALADRTRSA